MTPLLFRMTLPHLAAIHYLPDRRIRRNTVYRWCRSPQLRWSALNLPRTIRFRAQVPISPNPRNLQLHGEGGRIRSCSASYTLEFSSEHRQPSRGTIIVRETLRKSLPVGTLPLWHQQGHIEGLPPPDAQIAVAPPSRPPIHLTLGTGLLAPIGRPLFFPDEGVEQPRRTPTPSRLRENSEFRPSASGTGGPPGDSKSPISSTSLFKLLFTSCFSSYPIPHPFCQFLIIQ